MVVLLRPVVDAPRVKRDVHAHAAKSGKYVGIAAKANMIGVRVSARRRTPHRALPAALMYASLRPTHGRATPASR